MYQSMHTQVTPCPSKQQRLKPKVTVAPLPPHGCPCVGRCWRSELPWAWPRSRADQRRQLVLHKRSDAGGQAEVWATVSVSLVISATRTSRWQLLLHHFCTVTLAPLSPPPLHSQRYVQVLFRCHDFRAAVLGDTTTCPPTRSGSGPGDPDVMVLLLVYAAAQVAAATIPRAGCSRSFGRTASPQAGQGPRLSSRHKHPSTPCNATCT